MAKTKLYVLPGSHPSATAAKALEIKGVDYRTVELVELIHMPLQRMRFGAPTVPGVVFDDGEKVQGSVAIVHRLDERVPDPPLFPSDPEKRAAVEELERWGDEVLQNAVRRIVWWALRRNAKAMPSYLRDAKVKLPAPVVRTTGPLIAAGAGRVHNADDETVRADIRAMPEHLDRIDAAIRDGVIGGEPPNAADLQIASSVALLMTMDDLKRIAEGRPAAELANRIFPDWPGHLEAGRLPVDEPVPA